MKFLSSALVTCISLQHFTHGSQQHRNFDVVEQAPNSRMALFLLSSTHDDDGTTFSSCFLKPTRHTTWRTQNTHVLGRVATRTKHGYSSRRWTLRVHPQRNSALITGLASSTMQRNEIWWTVGCCGKSGIRGAWNTANTTILNNTVRVATEL